MLGCPLPGPQKIVDEIPPPLPPNKNLTQVCCLLLKADHGRLIAKTCLPGK